MVATGGSQLLLQCKEGAPSAEGLLAGTFPANCLALLMVYGTALLHRCTASTSSAGGGASQQDAGLPRLLSYQLELMGNLCDIGVAHRTARTRGSPAVCSSRCLQEAAH